MTGPFPTNFTQFQYFFEEYFAKKMEIYRKKCVKTTLMHALQAWRCTYPGGDACGIFAVFTILRPFAPMTEFDIAPHCSQGGVIVEIGS